MSNSSETCSVCLSSNAILIEVSAADGNQVKLSSKLNLCVPAVDWSGKCCICPKCIEQLEIAYIFCQLCLQSYEVRRQQTLLVIKTEEPPLESNEISEFQMKSCLNEDEIPTSSLMSIDEADGLTSVDDVVQRLNRCVENCMEEIPSIENMPVDDIEEKYNDLNNVFLKTEESCDIDTEESTSNVISSHLPEKSRLIYESAYERFEKWCEEKKIKNVTNQKVLLAYFEHKSKFQKPSSLWSYYSMLRRVISLKKNVDISKYTHLIAFLKRKAKGYRVKKSKILTKQDITKFFREADDTRFLMMKVALIIGLGGACRRDELTNLLVENVKDEGQFFRFIIPNAQTNSSREFFITSGDIDRFNMVEIVRKYMLLRPKHTNHRRFFVSYRSGKCTTQPVGIHTFGNMPKTIASYLKLPNHEEYTGHCFRRSSMSLLVDSAPDIEESATNVISSFLPENSATNVISSFLPETSAANVISSLLPEKSKLKYVSVYERFEKWCEENEIKNVTNEKVLLAYFEHKSKFQKPSSLWPCYSMLRSVISLKKNVDISKYTHLIAFLKGKSKGYKVKKSKILTKQDVTKFFHEADDYTFLMMKVTLIIGLGGACRRDELTNLLLENVEDEGQFFRIVIPNAQTKISREFFVTSGDIDGLNLVEIVRKYVLLRPKQTDHSRFFVSYRSGKCTKQPVGIHTFGNMPKIIASYLNLPNHTEYTGHCFRRSSKSLLVDSRVNLLTVKRYRGWKSNAFAK